MLRHLFKLIWNKKKQNFLLIVEMFISFLVMFAVFSFIVYYYQNYRRPMGLEYERVWAINYDPPPNIHRADSIDDFNQSLKNTLRSMPEVEEVSFAEGNYPFSNSQHNSSVSLAATKNTVTSDIYTVDDSYQKVLRLNMLEGKWFTRDDHAGKERHVVINESLRTALFGKKDPIGQYLSGGLGIDDDRLKIVGLVADTKDRGDYEATHSGIYVRSDTSFIGFIHAVLIRVKPGADAAFEGRLYKVMANAVTNTSIEIEHLSKKRESRNQLTLIPVIIILIVAAFLIINVALGLFGVLWYTISKRRAEIGLRRAVGATGFSISKQLVTETMVLASFSLILGCFFAIQFPLLRIFDIAPGVYLVAILLAVAFIYLLVTICALYPGKQAADIYPAVALHED